MDMRIKRVRITRCHTAMNALFSDAGISWIIKNNKDVMYHGYGACCLSMYDVMYYGYGAYYLTMYNGYEDKKSMDYQVSYCDEYAL